MKRIIYLTLGFIGLILGAVGAVVPLLPAFPFLLLSAWAFSRSSEKLDTWFKGTTLYKNNLETFVKKEGMYMHVKIRVVILITILLSIGFIMMPDVLIGRIVIIFVWLFHVIYFFCFVKTVEATNND